jgi:hypothetical protein
MLLERGMPAATAEPILRTIGVGEETLAKLPEVVAHQHGPLPRTARLLILLLGSASVMKKVALTPARS